MLGLETYVRARVDKRYQHLMQLRVSALNQCVFCLAMHRREAKKDGWSEEKISSTERWTDFKEQFTDEECAALELTDAVSRIHGAKGARNLLMAIVAINAWNRIGITTRLNPRSLSGVDDFDLGIRAKANPEGTPSGF